MRGSGVDDRTARREELDGVSMKLRDLIVDDLFRLEEELGAASMHKDLPETSVDSRSKSSKPEPPA